MKFAVAISGASGSIYGVRLLQKLPGTKILVISETAKEILPIETGLSVEEVYAMADEVYEDDDLFASIASGSYRYDCMFVAPCSESSVGKFANGIADNLISRAASVRIKEGQKLVLVVRETPKSQIMLENELKLARCGVVILDANPGFYSKPQSIDDVVDFVVGKTMDAAGIVNNMFERWN